MRIYLMKIQWKGKKVPKQRDYDGYTKSLEKIYEGLSKSYWTEYVDINRHQISVGKLYLWVSVTLLGFYFLIFNEYNEYLLKNNYIIIFSIFSCLLGGLAFAICLYAIPARRGYHLIPKKGWGEFSEEVYKYIDDNKPQIYAKFLTSHISKIDYAWAHNIKTNKKRAHLLRITSRLLICSFLFSVFSFISFYVLIGLV